MQKTSQASNLYIMAVKVLPFDESDTFLTNPEVGSLRPVSVEATLPYFLTLADGKKLKCSFYKELYATFGDTFCPKHIEEVDTSCVFQNFFRRLFSIKEVTKTILNPDYVEGYFRVVNIKNVYHFPLAITPVA